MGPIRFPTAALSVPQVSAAAPAAKPSADSVFRQLLGQAVQQVDHATQDADRQVSSLLRGENVEVHEVVLATQRAELGLEMFEQVRNKMVQAYQEVMRMPL